jgi:transcriptional regulator with XRE-family HTH domain
MSKATAGAMIRDARKARGWTIDELADRLSASPTTIHNWETGKTAPGLQDVNPLCAALPSLSPDVLLIELGVTLTPPAAARLPRELVHAALQLDAFRLEALTEAARGLLLRQQDQDAQQRREPQTPKPSRARAS